MQKEILAALVVPGWTARGRRRRLAWSLLSVGVALPVGVVAYVVVSGRNRVALGLDAGFLLALMVVGALAVVTRVIAIGEIWLGHDHRSDASRGDRVALGSAAVALLVASTGIVEVGRARASIAPVFDSAGDTLYDRERSEEAGGVAPPPTEVPADGRDDTPTTVATSVPTGPITTIVPEARSVTPSTTSTVPPKPSRPDSGVTAAELADVTTVLLLGGDAGPGRSGLRTDSMILFSVHRPSGRASLVSIPRDLRRLLFPPGSALEARHPYGYDGLANAVYPEVSARGSLREAYRVDGVRPGVVALAQAIGYSLDVTIHDYVLIDMEGFLDLVDALGGVSVRVTKQIPMPGNVPGAPTQYPDVIGPGVVEMDGTTALGYVRSRKGDNDYQRARRRRELLAALAQQVSVTDVALSFGSVADAVGGTLRTSLSPDELVETVNVIGGETAIVESVGLVPPLVNLGRPDYDRLAEIVGAVQLALVTGERSGY